MLEITRLTHGTAFPPVPANLQPAAGIIATLHTEVLCTPR